MGRHARRSPQTLPEAIEKTYSWNERKRAFSEKHINIAWKVLQKKGGSTPERLNVPTDTSEKGLESLIVDSLVSEAKYEQGQPKDYDRDYAVDLAKLLAFLRATQPKLLAQLGLDEEGPKRQQFLARLQGEITKRGVVDVLRKGIDHGPVSVDLFYGTPTPGNTKAEEQYRANIFSVTRQLRYSKDETQLALDLCIFINGLPIATFELKNKLTKQTVDDAKQQYKRDRDPRELLFQFGRCAVHFAVDDHEVRDVHASERQMPPGFFPLTRDGTTAPGNPPNPEGLKPTICGRKSSPSRG